MSCSPLEARANSSCHSPKSTGRSLILLSGLVLFATGLHGQSPPEIVALAIPSGIIVDGKLDDEPWSRAAVGSGFTQREPHEGEPATERTEFQVVYTPSHLYIAVTAHQGQPPAIVAKEMERDAPLYRDDSVAIVLDTFADGRNGYVFETNANGARFDALITDEGSNVNVEWDGVWTVASRRTVDGWTAELAIPFSTLRFGPASSHWGLNVRRMIRRKSEEVNWAPLGFADGDPADRSRYAAYRMSLAGRLLGLEDLHPSRQIDVTPFLVNDTSRRHSTDAGLDVKWGLTRNLVLDLTFNTDFAEVEIDEQQVNLTRFSLFFPEKRDFFLENAGIFEYGLPQRDARSPILMKVFFSRRIGLDEGREVPINYGARLTGRVGGWNLGVLDVTTDATEFDDGSSVASANFGVIRLQRNLGKRSAVGLVYTDHGDSKKVRNRVFGVDFDYQPTRHFDLAGFASQSHDDRSVGDDWAAGYSVGYRAGDLEASLDHLRVNEGYRPDIGFLLRHDFERFRPRVRWRPRIMKRGLRSWYFEGDYDYFARASLDQLESRRLSISVIGLRTMFDDGFALNWDDNTERLFEPFEIQPGIIIPPGLYEFTNWRVGGASGEGRPASVRVRASAGDFFDGTRFSANVTLRIRASRYLRAETLFDYNDVSLPQGDFVTRVIGQRLGVSFSPDIRFNAFVQFDQSAELVASNLRFNWHYRPGSDLFVVYNENWNAPTFTSRQPQDRQLIVKLTYLWQR